MINQQDVITIKLPFPNISSDLAVTAHMYICDKRNKDDYFFVECQTFRNKFYHLHNYIIERADITRNPFKNTFLIDCDKLFNIRSVSISEDLLTRKRRDVSEELFNEIENKLIKESYLINEIDRLDVSRLNRKINLLPR
ncbi:hypothetical protein PT285_07310 [Lactobacillus sp. ESL0791]|uniref:hypothetical protein n=1 Tax=Lactobacillus sp. ESL0791 TaxID=2983234 RepID=UPI0023F66D38|nr:hypothetical protein [Lactobacillus sp. ESL0791]MDF7639207.1 hypothetical protein [Lactobacillus sp. ESL0791]